MCARLAPVPFAAPDLLCVPLQRFALGCELDKGCLQAIIFAWGPGPHAAKAAALLCRAEEKSRSRNSVGKQSRLRMEIAPCGIMIKFRDGLSASGPAPFNPAPARFDLHQCSAGSPVIILTRAKGPTANEDMAMKLSRRSVLLGAAAGGMAAAVLSLPAAAAGVTINVALWDKGAMSMETMGKMHGRGMGMKSQDMPMAMMGITIDQASVPAGEVTFAVTNTSKDMIHEMVVSPIADTTTPLPYIEDEQRVDEDAAGHVGEVAELDVGAAGALTVTLTPGAYLLYCNIPGHYQSGMWTVVTVTG